MVEQLFGSKTRVKLLKLFFTNLNRSFYVREITRKIDEQINSVRRELSNLLSIGIISSDTNNNKLYYEVNQQYDYFKPLLMIFGGKQKAGATSVKATAAPKDSEEINHLKQLGRVDLALYTGQFTRDDSSGIDVLIVGDINKTQLDNFIKEMEQKEGKDIAFTVMSTGEFKYRHQVKDRFLALVLASKKQILIDKIGALK